MSKHDEWLRDFKPVPMHTYLDNSVRDFPFNPAMDFMGKEWTYKELGKLVDKATVGFQNLGVKKGVQVGLCLPNCPYFTICHYAILKAGGTVVNYNPLYVTRDIKYQAENSNTKIMVTLDVKEIYNKVDELLQDGTLNRVIVCPLTDALSQPKKMLFKLFKARDLAKVSYKSARISFNELISNGDSPRPVEIDPKNDLAVLQYTGGTTGRPKGAMLTHENLSANLEQVRYVFEDAILGHESILCVLPFFHVFAMTGGQNLSIMLGAKMVLLPRFDLGVVLNTIKKTQVTIFPGVPTIFNAICNSRLTKRKNLSSIRYCVSGGAPLPTEVKAEFEQQTDCVLVEGYGLTEASPIVALNPLDGTDIPGSIGRPLIGTKVKFRNLREPKGSETGLESSVKSVDEKVEMFGKDKLDEVIEKGVLCVKGPQVMKGFWKDEEETNKVIDEDGYLNTADVGYQDKSGSLFLVDRVKDLIICSGYNVYPRRIEEALYRHKDVEEAIVIGIPDKYRGEAPKAFMTLHEGAKTTKKELEEFLRQNLSTIEIPREIEFRSELPKTLIGKLSKKELVEEESAKAAAMS